MLYEFRIKIVYIIFMMYALCKNISHISTNFCIHFAYKLFTKCIQNICIQNVSYISTNFCMQNVYKIFVYKMYTTFRQTFVYILYTKFSWRSFFNFVYKSLSKYVYILYKFFIHHLYTSCTTFLYKMYTKILCGLVRTPVPFLKGGE